MERLLNLTVETMEGVGSGEACGSNDPTPGGVGAGDMEVGGSVAKGAWSLSLHRLIFWAIL